MIIQESGHRRFLQNSTNGTDPVELSMVGPFLLGEDSALFKMVEISNLGFTSDHFQSRACRSIWTKVLSWIEHGVFTREKLLSHCLKSDDIQLDPPSRSMWIAEACEIGSPIHMVENAIELMERKVRRETEEAIQRLPSESKGASELLDALEFKLSELRLKTLGRNEDEKLAACNELHTELEAMIEGKGSPLEQSNVIPWDQCLAGLPKSQLIVLAGRPGGGKTALAEQVIDEALHRHIPVLYIQRELSRSRAVGRLAARKAGIPWSSFELRRLSKQQAVKLNTSVSLYKELPLFLAPIGTCTGASVASMVRYHAKQHGVKIVVLDHLQLIDSPRGVELRHAIGDVTRALKLAANETGVLAIAISQLSRLQERSEQKPKKSDLNESGRIEQDADVILALWNKERDDNAIRWPVNWSILKNRNGAEGTVEVIFDGPSMSFLGRISKEREENRTLYND